MRGQDDMDPIVIIGSGLGGYTVASEYRKLDQQRDMLLISQDDGSAYAKPILSNALAQNKSLEQLASTPAAEMARRLNMTVLTRQTVLAIDTQLQTIRTSSSDLFYGDLVLALGAHDGGHGADAGP